MFIKKITQLAAISTLIFSFNAQAALVSFDFETTVPFGLFENSIATGTVTFDYDLLTGIGEEIITIDDGLTIELNAFGQAFTQNDDVGIGAPLNPYPLLELFDGAPEFLNFFISEVAFTDPDTGIFQNNIRALTTLGLESFGAFSLDFYDPFDDRFFGKFSAVEYSSVPVPASMWLFGSTLLGFIAIRRRKKS